MAKKDTEPTEIEDTDIDGEELEILEDLDEDPSMSEDGDDDDDDSSDRDDDDDDDDESMGATIVRKAGDDDDDDDDDMVAPDDMEEDLAAILKDRLASEDLPAEDDDDVVETDDRTGSDESLQPKRDDETLCSSCFLLVRDSAPRCPIGDDSCPVFVR